MDVPFEDDWHPSAKLNAVGAAIDVGAQDPLPAEVSRDQIEESCYTLEQLYGEYVDELVAETELSRREAQTWVLRNLVYEGAEPLSYEAIGLYIWAIGRSTEGDPLSRTIVTDYYERAQAKIDRAEATVMRTGPPPYPDELYDDPTIIWVDEVVGSRLQRRLGPEETFSDLLSRLLDETADSVSLESLLAAYREAGSEYAAVDTVYPDWDRTLRVVVQLPPDGQTPDTAAAESVLVGDRILEYKTLEQESVTPAESHIPLFGPETDSQSRTIAEGLDAVRDALDAVEVTVGGLVESVRETGGIAIAVGAKPTGAGAHLYPIYHSGPETVPDRLAVLDRLSLDDRTLEVSAVSPVGVKEYLSLETPTEILWADAGIDGIEGRDLPADPVAQRERIPNEVLWTS